MKKFAAGLFAATIVFMGITALAADETKDVYFGSDNSVHFTDADDDVGKYTTVLIRKSGTIGADGVVYVDQQSNGFSGVVDFMLKNGTADGAYTATFGNSNGDAKTVNFSVGNRQITATNENTNVSETITLNPKTKMTVIDEADSTDDETFDDKDTSGGTKYKKGFVFTATNAQYNSFDRLYLVSADGKNCYGYFELKKDTNITTDGSVAYGIQIYNIPESHKGMNLYLGEVSN